MTRFSTIPFKSSFVLALIAGGVAAAAIYSARGNVDTQFRFHDGPPLRLTIRLDQVGAGGDVRVVGDLTNVGDRSLTIEAPFEFNTDALASEWDAATGRWGEAKTMKTFVGTMVGPGLMVMAPGESETGLFRETDLKPGKYRIVWEYESDAKKWDGKVSWTGVVKSNELSVEMPVSRKPSNGP